MTHTPGSFFPCARDGALSLAIRPSLWSYISMTGRLYLEGNVRFPLQRSKSFPLSIRVTALSQMSEMDRLGIQVDRTQSQIERRLDRLQSQIERGLDRLKSRIERKMDMMEIRLAGFGSVLELEPIADDTLELGPIADGYLGTWTHRRRYLGFGSVGTIQRENVTAFCNTQTDGDAFTLSQRKPSFINSTAALFAQGNRDAPFLQEFRLETSRSWQDMWSVNAGVERNTIIHQRRTFSSKVDVILRHTPC